jgi:transposase
LGVSTQADLGWWGLARGETDPRDAWILADFARRNLDRLAWIQVTDELLVRLRVLNGRDVDLATDANRVSNRCRDALVAVSPALERAVGQRLAHGGVRDVQAALAAQSVTLPAEETWGEVIADLIGDLDRIQRRRDELAVTIEEVFLSHPLGKVLVTLCGFGPRTGARTLAEIGDPHRFLNGSRLAGYAGLAPTDRRSGRSLNSAHQQRGGNHRLKNAMFIAAFVAAQHDPEARAYYQRKRAEGKKHNAAVTCVARRRCDLILAHAQDRHPIPATSRPNRRLTTRQEHPPLASTVACSSSIGLL